MVESIIGHVIWISFRELTHNFIARRIVINSKVNCLCSQFQIHLGNLFCHIGIKVFVY
jgi:hypothetical protein